MYAVCRIFLTKVFLLAELKVLVAAWLILLRTVTAAMFCKRHWTVRRKCVSSSSPSFSWAIPRKLL